MAELRIPIIGEFKGQKAFKDAGKATSTLDKSVKRLGSTLAATFGATQLLKFAKNAAKAFIEDEQAATRLAQSVKNLGLAFETPRIEEFIAQLSRASGVTDDQLRPSMQKLLQTTGSVAKSTALLTQALDISRGSGVDFETVVNDLSMAYVGQTRGLRKYALGISQAELKTMSFEDVQARLNKQFSGANAAYLETYAGKMQILSTAAGEAQETIGKGLVDSLSLLAGEGNTIQPLADSMQDFATYVSDAIYGVAVLIDKMKAIPGMDFLLKNQKLLRENVGSTAIIFKALDYFKTLGAEARPEAGMGGYPSSALGGVFIDPNDAARKAAEAAAAKRAKELAALQKKTLDTQKKSLALQKASKTLNLEAIGIEAALKGSISETDRLSLLLQKSILEGNATLATQLSDQLEAAIKRNNELRLALLATPKAPNPYEDWKIPDDILNYTAKSLGVSPETVISAPQNIPMQATDAGEEVRLAALAAMDAQAKAEAAQAAADAAAVYVKITLPDGTDMTSQAKTELTNQALSGSFVNVNRLGRFANTPVAL
jgi:hypothetical protein